VFSPNEQREMQQLCAFPKKQSEMKLCTFPKEQSEMKLCALPEEQSEKNETLCSPQRTK
jgi:hypothetical protein